MTVSSCDIRSGHSPYQIAIVDNDPRVLESLVAFFRSRMPVVCVLWCARSAAEALQRLKNDRPDLLIVDMALEGVQGPSLCRRIRVADGDLPILGVTSYTIGHYKSALAKAGAQGLVSKSDDDLISAVGVLRVGDAMPGFEMPNTAHMRLLCSPDPEPLSQKEETVISLCAEGLGNIDIARVMGIAESTVRKHLEHALKKLGCRTSRQAVAVWIRNNDHAASL